MKKIELNNNGFEDIILSLALTREIGTTYEKSNTENQFFRRINFNFNNADTILLFNNKEGIDITDESGVPKNPKDLIRRRLDEFNRNAQENGVPIDKQGYGNIFTIHYDLVTRTVFVLENLEMKRIREEAKEPNSSNLGKLMLNYYDIWYLGKVGMGKEESVSHVEFFKTFNTAEKDMLQQGLIPIFVTPSFSPVISKMISRALFGSVIGEHIKMVKGYSINGKRINSSYCFWCSKDIAKEYLNVTTAREIISRHILEGILKHSGLLGEKATYDLSLLNNRFDERQFEEVAEEEIIRRTSLTEKPVEKTKIEVPEYQVSISEFATVEDDVLSDLDIDLDMDEIFGV